MDKKAKYMTKQDVIPGRRFHHKETFRSNECNFSKHMGKGIYMRQGSYKHVGEVTAVFEDAFQLSVWIFGQEATVLIPFSECIIIEPKNN